MDKDDCQIPDGFKKRQAENGSGDHVGLNYNFNNLYFDGENEKELYESKLMRGDAGVYWKDMKLQHAGFTWDYFAPQLVENRL